MTPLCQGSSVSAAPTQQLQIYWWEQEEDDSGHLTIHQGREAESDLAP